MPPIFTSPYPGRRLSIFLISIILLGAALLYWHGRSAEQPRPATAAVPVRSGKVVRRDLSVWLPGIGTVQALNTVTVKSRVDGQLQRVAFQEGQMVVPGQLLAEIDRAPFQAALDQAAATVRKDQALRTNAELDLQRYAKLSQLQVVSQQQLDTQRAQAESLLATVAADQGALDNARLQLGYTRISAPIAGRVGQRLVDQGAQVQASDTTGLVTITQLEPITVAFSVPQDALAEVQAAQRDHAPRVLASRRDNGVTLADGALSFIDSQVDATTGQVLLKAQFANTDHRLWPGAFVAARLLLRIEPRALCLPSRALQRDQQGSFVYVIDTLGHAQPRPVRTGVSDAGYTEIRAGLREGERVVLDGQANLSAGAPIVEQATVTAGNDTTSAL